MSVEKQEKIGHVTLDLSVYGGEDKYSDGEIEDTLLEIARERSSVEYQSIIEESASWPILYHLSPLRENIVNWLPIDSSMKVLEVGSGCGAVTGALAAKAGSVTCCDLSLKRSRINAYRHMYYDNITIHVGNFTDVERTLDKDFDLICLIGVFEYAGSYIDSDSPYEDFLKLIGGHIKRGGRIVIAIENRFGLKYWAGCREDHLGTYFSSIEGYPDGGSARTFTDRRLISIAEACGYTEYHMYYPYPDYKFMTDLYSDRRLPHRGELKNNIRNFDRDRLLLFNEKEAFDTIIDDGLFNLYSNSYMLLIGPDPEVDYVRFSNDRSPEYCISTKLFMRDGSLVISKQALSDEASLHIKHMYDSYRKLKRRYSGKDCKIKVCGAKLVDDKTIELEYAKGVSLEELLDDCLIRGDTDGFVELFKTYLDRIRYGEERADITDIDLIFSNILIDGDDWTIIDYEWTTPDIWSAQELGFRAIYCYILEDERRNKLSLDLILNLLNISPERADDLRAREMDFQKLVTGRHKSLAEIRDLIGYEIIRMDGGDSESGSRALPNMQTQIYEDTGKGFNEAESYFSDSPIFTMEVPSGRRALRIDPCSAFCVVTVHEITWNGTDLSGSRRRLKHNGRRIGRGVYAFATSDPGFTVDLKGLKEQTVNLLSVSMTVTELDADTAGRVG